jgi:hypothetical protein
MLSQFFPSFLEFFCIFFLMILLKYVSCFQGDGNLILFMELLIFNLSSALFHVVNQKREFFPHLDNLKITFLVYISING